MLGLDIVYLCTKFVNCILSHSRDVVGAHQNLNGSHDLPMPLSGMVCHPWACTCCDQPIYQIWNLCLHPPRRYDRRYKMWKMGWFGV